MKSISEAIKRLSPKKLTDLKILTEIKQKSAEDIAASICTVGIMNRLLSTLSRNELRVLEFVYSQKKFTTFGEIEKKLNISIDELDQISESLSKKILIYPIKNRQLLSKKLDKIYCVEEIGEVIKFNDCAQLRKILENLCTGLWKKGDAKSLASGMLSADEIKILKFMLKRGCFDSYLSIEKNLKKNNLNASIESLVNKKILAYSHIIDPEFRTCLIINEEYVEYLSSLIDEKKSDVKVKNKYNLLNCLMYAYDTISTYGLFLTKQGKFRIIDRRRITDNMLDINDIDGTVMKPETISALALFSLSRLGCLEIEKDIAYTSLTTIKNEIESPAQLLLKIFREIEENDNSHPLLDLAVDIPSYKMIKQSLKILLRYSEIPLMLLQIALMARILSDLNETELIESEEKITLYSDRTSAIIRLLVISGVIDIDGKTAKLSDAGLSVASLSAKKPPEEPAPVHTKSLYINPDFSVLIPVEEIPSEALYHLLSYMEIEKKDVILHAKIDRVSIVKALKRGMPLNKFIWTLENYSKNRIPQNLNFLINEWSNQTVVLEISNSILLKTSHPAFIEELEKNKKNQIIIEKISPLIAVIKKSSIDDVVAAAKKNNAVVSLFENDDSWDES